MAAKKVKAETPQVTTMTVQEYVANRIASVEHEMATSRAVYKDLEQEMAETKTHYGNLEAVLAELRKLQEAMT